MVEGGRSSQPGHCPHTAWVSQVPSSLWGELGNLYILFQTQPSAFERTTKLACVVAQSLCSAFCCCCCFKQQFIKHKIFLIYWLYCDLLASSYYVNTEIKEWLRLPSLAEDKHKHSYNTEKLQWLRGWECQRRPLRWHLGELVLQSGLRGQCLTSFVVLPSFPVAGKAASLYPAVLIPLSDIYTLTDSGSVHYCVLSWVLATHKPSSLFGVLFVLRKGLFL